MAGPLEQAKLEDLDALYRTNVRAAFALTQAGEVALEFTCHFDLTGFGGEIDWGNMLHARPICVPIRQPPRAFRACGQSNER